MFVSSFLDDARLTFLKRLQTNNKHIVDTLVLMDSATLQATIERAAVAAAQLAAKEAVMECTKNNEALADAAAQKAIALLEPRITALEKVVAMMQVEIQRLKNGGGGGGGVCGSSSSTAASNGETCFNPTFINVVIRAYGSMRKRWHS